LDMASVRIESGTLTSADVLHNFNAGVPGQPPPPPLGVVALRSGSNVNLTWVTDSSAVTYDVYRSLTPAGEGATPIASGITSTSFTDTTAVSGQPYYYQISAIN